LFCAGELQVETRDSILQVTAGQAIIVRASEWVRYATPAGSASITVGLPPFSPSTVHRDE
jgi:hypothetical protein